MAYTCGKCGGSGRLFAYQFNGGICSICNGSGETSYDFKAWQKKKAANARMMAAAQRQASTPQAIAAAEQREQQRTANRAALRIVIIEQCGLSKADAYELMECMSRDALQRCYAELSDLPQLKSTLFQLAEQFEFEIAQ